jgi:hypothetical protein
VAALDALTRVNQPRYYRDDRVVRSLDLDTRARLPTGNEVKQGD